MAAAGLASAQPHETAPLAAVAERWRMGILTGNTEELLGVPGLPCAVIEDDFSIFIETPSDARALIEALVRLLGPARRYDIDMIDIRPIGNALYSMRFRSTLELGNGWTFDPGEQSVILGQRDGRLQVLSTVCFLKNLMPYIVERRDVTDLKNYINTLMRKPEEGPA